MKFLDKLTKKTKVFQRTIGLTVQQIDLLTEKIRPHWNSSEEKRKQRADRKRKIGGGHRYKLEDLREKLLVVLLYYKLYLTQEFLGMVIDLDQANISRLLKKMLPLIEQAADPELTTYLNEIKDEVEKIGDWAAFFRKHPELKDISTDATEQQCYRSTNNDIQKKHYSGKKKKHTLKTQISVTTSGRIVDISASYPGSIHDKTIIDQEKTIHKFPQKTCLRFDSGYQGIKEDSPNHYIVLPTKKPKGKDLSPSAKEHNRINSKRRVIVEHVYSRLKKFRVLGLLYRGPISSYNQIFRCIASVLNFRLANPVISM
jgi:hypothetical protein